MKSPCTGMWESTGLLSPLYRGISARARRRTRQTRGLRRRQSAPAAACEDLDDDRESAASVARMAEVGFRHAAGLRVPMSGI